MHSMCHLNILPLLYNKKMLMNQLNLLISRMPISTPKSTSLNSPSYGNCIVLLGTSCDPQYSHNAKLGFVRYLNHSRSTGESGLVYATSLGRYKQGTKDQGTRGDPILLGILCTSLLYWYLCK